MQSLKVTLLHYQVYARLDLQLKTAIPGGTIAPLSRQNFCFSLSQRQCCTPKNWCRQFSNSNPIYKTSFFGPVKDETRGDALRMGSTPDTRTSAQIM